jgi:nucleoside-diphosphate-sugar epimerase
MFCQEYWAERGLETHIARFHNVYGPCFDQDTEVLTDSGWKLFKDVATDEKIASLNPETHELEYVKQVVRQCYHYAGPMYRVSAQAVEQLVTPDHSVYMAFATTRGTSTRAVSPFKLCKASETRWDRARMAFTSFCHWSGGDAAEVYTLPECSMKDGRRLHESRPIPMRLWFAFMGWYISEGSSFVTPSNYTVNISQQPGEKQDEIIALIREMGFRPYVNGRNITVSNKQLYECVQEAGQGAHNKRIPRWMLTSSAENLGLLFETLVKGDGHRTQRQYSTVSRQLADDFAELCLKLGIHPVTWRENDRIYRISLSRRERLWTHRKNRTIEHYDGLVYDVTLEKNHILMVRRHGKPAWSGNCGTWDGGREKAPAAICRKVIEAKDTGHLKIDIWGDGNQTRSFCYIDDCLLGIDLIMHCDKLIATPVNLGSSELVSINELVSLVEEIAGVKLQRRYDLEAPQGVAGRNSDNTFIQSVLNWEPNTPLRVGLARTYAWIEQQYYDRKAGKRVVQD